MVLFVVKNLMFNLHNKSSLKTSFCGFKIILKVLKYPLVLFKIFKNMTNSTFILYLIWLI